MKSNIIKEKSYDSENIVLSVGLIVKNEEKVLERCLKSLIPLMNSIKCEIIIADTGSTDSTVEIAKKYTDKVYHFEWIDDFAAARNSTLKRAKGQWYMFVDADEYLDEDVSEMINFFNREKLRSEVRSAEIIVRNYADGSFSNFSDVYLPRLRRIDDKDENVEFIGKIHETIPSRYPLVQFSTILHHTGYVYDSVEQKSGKMDRNYKIMIEEYKKNPNDLRLLSHLISGTTDIDECEEYITKALELVSVDRENLYSNAVFLQAISHYKGSRPEYALKLCDDYYKGTTGRDKYVATLSVKKFKAEIYQILGRNNESYNEYNEYINLYKKYKEKKLNNIDLTTSTLCCVSQNDYNCVFLNSVICLNNLKKYDDALNKLEEFRFIESEIDDFKRILSVIKLICINSKKYNWLAKFYGIQYNSLKKEKQKLILDLLDNIYYSFENKKDREIYVKEFVDSGVTGRYADYLSLVYDENSEDIVGRLQKFMQIECDLEDNFYECIYLSLKYRMDISQVVSKINPQKYKLILSTISYAHDDFSEYVLNYGFPDSFSKSIKLFFWMTCMTEIASYRSFKLDDEEKFILYNRFISFLGDYVNNIYNTELLNDDDIEVIPELHRFGYFMSQANTSLLMNDRVAYIRWMKTALVNCESMKEIVEFLLNQFRKSL